MIVGRALSWLSESHLRAAAALCLLALACFLPGLSTIPPVDRDEARFVEATKEMVQSGNYVDIRMHGVPRYKKPIGIYWIQVAALKISGYGADAPIWVYRVPSVLGGLAAVLLAYWAALPLFGRRAAVVTGVLLCASLALVMEAHLARTNAVLEATVILSMGALARLYLWKEQDRSPLPLALVFWVGLGLSILIKGPIGPMVAGLAILVLVAVERRYAWLGRLRPLVGIPVLLVIVIPWFVAIFLIAGTAFFKSSVGTDMMGKVATGQESHGLPPGTHFVLFWFMAWPGTLLVPLAARWVWRQRAEPAVRFCLAWLIPSWLVFEAVATKLPYYTLPMFPAIGALVGGAIVAGGIDTGRWWTRALAVPAALIGVAIPIAGTVALLYVEGTVSWPSIILSVIALALAIASVVASYRDDALTAATGIIACGVVASLAFFGFLMPNFQSFQLSPRLAAAVKAAPCPEPKVVSAGFAEPSLVFLVGADIEISNGVEAADFMAEGGCRIALIDASKEADFQARLKELGKSAERLTTVEGRNISRLGRVSIGVYRAAGP